MLNWILFFVTVAVVFAAGIFTASIMERRAEKAARLQIVREIPEWEPRNEIWGENFPKEWESYLKTGDTSFASLHGGSATIDYLEEYPELVILWAGYPFSIDYKQGRGHLHAVKDVRQTLRTGGVDNSPLPATCWTCKSTDVPRMMNTVGVENFYNKKWIEYGEEIINPIGCQDCHDPKTMKLRITRPALVEAFERQGKSMKEFSNQDMRSLVCAQCHVEYYFQKDNKYLVFPWDKGFSADNMEEYYDNIEFSDWTHKLSRAPMLKAQHPDYELYKTGVHASRNVSCADCHMPYKVEGGIKFTDHHIGSPLQNIANACQTCHRESEEQLRNDVYSRQDKVLEIRRIAEKAIAAAHIEAKAAWDAGASEADMAPVLKNIRHAQWRWDWVAAANGVGFHSPVEALRVLGTAIQKAEKARGEINVILTKLGQPIPYSLPDVSTKEKAQKFVGIDIEAQKNDKIKLLETVVTEWDKAAKERQGTLMNY
ncbi:MAG: ammonia-forming cytochrome c nitrite reductase [Candidatus Kapabacteria bacterium]|nr:ammonia-forming cytochrome c nitrite reductase [Ignavibacteriota bacterium]MCW5883939.1 ammonia-forming cytochrome c nitrite reductase [Candidatus Kapabacteria bacterium]